jgi:hypothetical protein
LRDDCLWPTSLSAHLTLGTRPLRTAEDELASAGWARERFVALLLLGFAVFALMLAVVGLYSVVSYSVSCRFKELASVWRSVPVAGAL